MRKAARVFGARSEAESTPPDAIDAPWPDLLSSGGYSRCELRIRAHEIGHAAWISHKFACSTRAPIQRCARGQISMNTTLVEERTVSISAAAFSSA